MYRSLEATESHMLTQNSVQKFFSFSYRNIILIGKAVCLKRTHPYKSTKETEQISAILGEKEMKLPLGSKTLTGVLKKSTIGFYFKPWRRVVVEIKEAAQMRDLHSSKCRLPLCSHLGREIHTVTAGFFQFRFILD